MVEEVWRELAAGWMADDGVLLAGGDRSGGRRNRIKKIHQGPPPSSSSPPSASLLTLPSLLDPPSFSASFLCLSSIQTAGGAVAATVVVSTPIFLLYVASAAEISVYDLTSLHRDDSFPAAPAAGSFKLVTFSLDDRAFTAHQDGLTRA